MGFYVSMEFLKLAAITVSAMLDTQGDSVMKTSMSVLKIHAKMEALAWMVSTLSHAVAHLDSLAKN